MLVKFKSKNAGDVLMYGEHAKRILDLLRKDASRGVITAAEMDDAVTTLEAAIAESKVHPASDELKFDVDAHHGESGDDKEHEAGVEISFATRALPLLEMLRAARKDRRDILWGV